MRLLKLVFRLIIVAFAALSPMPTFPVQYFTVGTVQEYVMPRGPEGTQDPTIVYWERAVRTEEAWTEGHGEFRARCEEADIQSGSCLDLWTVRDPGGWERLSDLGAWFRPGDGRIDLAAPFPLAATRLVIFRDLSCTLDPASFDARDWFEDWPPPL